MMWNKYYWKIQSWMLVLTLQREPLTGGDNKPINLNSMSLNQVLAFLKKILNFQGTVDLSLNNPTTGPKYSGHHWKCNGGRGRRNTSGSLSRNWEIYMKGPPINEK